MSITPFHFACHCEERLRAQFEIFDQPLGSFVEIRRQFSLTEGRASLLFGKKPAAGEDFEAYATLKIQLVPQKEAQTALNCTLECPSQKMQQSFRLLMIAVEEAETRILKVTEFLQKAFLPLGYTTVAPKPIEMPKAAVKSEPTSVDEISPEELAAILAPSDTPAAGAATATATAAKVHTTESVQLSETEVEKTLSDGKKYIVEQTPPKGSPVKMRTPDGKYIPEGELPATVRVNKN